MKLLRIGSLGKEKPVVLDKDGKYKDLSLHIEDLNPNSLNFETSRFRPFISARNF